MAGTHLEGLDKSPQQDADGVALPKQLDEPCCPEEAEKAKVDEVVLRGGKMVLRTSGKKFQRADHPIQPSQVSKSQRKVRGEKSRKPSLQKQPPATRTLRSQACPQTTSHAASRGRLHLNSLPAPEGTRASSLKQIPAAQ